MICNEKTCGADATYLILIPVKHKKTVQILSCHEHVVTVVELLVVGPDRQRADDRGTIYITPLTEEYEVGEVRASFDDIVENL